MSGIQQQWAAQCAVFLTERRVLNHKIINYFILIRANFLAFIKYFIG